MLCLCRFDNRSRHWRMESNNERAARGSKHDIALRPRPTPAMNHLHDNFSRGLLRKRRLDGLERPLGIRLHNNLELGKFSLSESAHEIGQSVPLSVDDAPLYTLQECTGLALGRNDLDNIPGIRHHAEP